MKVTNRYFTVIILISFFIFFSSEGFYRTKGNVQSIYKKVVGEGTVEQIIPVRTHEISSPSGYAIQNPVWILSPGYANSIVFLRSNKISLHTFVGKRVRFEGEFSKIPYIKHNQESSSNPYDRIILDTIYVIN